MKKTITKLSLLIIVILTVNSDIMAQADMLMGRRGNGTVNSDSLIYADTIAGGNISIVESKFITTTLAATNVDGIFGMALNPFTDEMFVVYGVDAVSGNRRLGIIDVATAIITDIAQVGSISDIAFMDSTLYTTTGSNFTPAHSFGTLSKTSGAFDLIYTHSNPQASNALTFDMYKNRFLKASQGDGFEGIDAVTKVESTLSSAGLPWTTGILPISDSSAFTVGDTEVQYLNTNNLTQSSVFDFGNNNYLHSVTFTSYNTSLWVNGKRDTCVGNWELTVVGTGTVYQWYKDGVLLAGVSGSTYVVNESGDYHVVVDGVETNEVTVVINAPKITAIVTDAAGAVPGGIDITVTGGAGSYTFDWDTDGTGDFDDTEDLTSLVPNSYVVVAKDAAGCTGTETFVVNQSVGINELESELISISPNPTSDKVILTLEGEFKYQLINPSGELLEVAGKAVNKEEVSLTGFPNGVYFLRISANNKIKTIKVIKQ